MHEQRSLDMGHVLLCMYITCPFHGSFGKGDLYPICSLNDSHCANWITSSLLIPRIAAGCCGPQGIHMALATRNLIFMARAECQRKSDKAGDLNQKFLPIVHPVHPHTHFPTSDLGPLGCGSEHGLWLYVMAFLG